MISRTLLVCLLAACSQDAADSAPEREWVRYEPAVMELSGTLTVRDEFGPPNYGETPETDSTVSISVLVLDDPINVLGDSLAQVNIETVENVGEVQLISGSPIDGSLISARVVVRGTLFKGHTGGHYTPVVMNVTTVALRKESP